MITSTVRSEKAMGEKSIGEMSVEELRADEMSQLDKIEKLMTCTNSGKSRAGYEYHLARLIGIADKGIIEKMGYPSKELTSPDGNKVFEYSGIFLAPFGPSPLGGDGLCVTWFEFKDRKLIKISSRGCRALLPNADTSGCDAK
jgi:hypothetical protein